MVAMSGGVDSTAAVSLLKDEGFDCQGVFMITHDEGQKAQVEAEEMARRLKVKLHVLDLRDDFSMVLDYFAGEYKRGRTPNPCVFCNRHIKFGRLWEFAKKKGADLLATGHYANIKKIDGEARLYESENSKKDQSYVLSMMRKEVLDHVLVPVGRYSKEEVIERIKELGLELEHREESQEICFIPDDDYISKLEEICPELETEGDIIDSSGKVLGKHMGIHRYTIGQRRGLKVAMGVPYYVTKIDAVNNSIVLGPKDEVMHKRFRASGANWLMENKNEEFAAKIKVRYNDRGSEGTVFLRGDDIEVEFEKEKSAVTPGQLAVIYVKDDIGSRVAGSAWIDEVLE